MSSAVHHASSIVAIIPARGGSKGVPRKNLRRIQGKPLIAFTIEQAQAARLVGRVIVSTDDDEIAALTEKLGAEVVRRPPELAGDIASSESALIHVLDHLKQREASEPDLVVFLQATAPIRSRGDVDGAIETLGREGADSLLSVVASHRFLWRLKAGLAEPLNYDPQARPRRQDRAPEFAENGSIYVFKPWVLRQFNCRLGGHVALFVMSPWSEVDIDAPADLELCEWIMSRREFEGDSDGGPSEGSGP